jgi:hypothetical protein
MLFTRTDTAKDYVDHSAVMPPIHRRQRLESAKGIVVKRREYLGFFLPPFFVGAANATDCLQHQVQELAPVIINPKTAVKKAEVCYEAFAVEHSGITRAPPWPAKHLVRGNIESEQSMISYPVCHSASKTWRQTLNLLHRTMKATTPVRREKIGMFHERPLRMTTVAHQQIKQFTTSLNIAIFSPPGSSVGRKFKIP